MPGRRAPEDARREQIVNAAYAVALRTGIAEVTLRAVAAQAGLSHGLVLFHFKRKDQLIAALLDRVLATTAMLDLSAESHRTDVSARRGAPARLAALLRQEVERLAAEPRGMRLFFEYWALGVRKATIRAKIAAALERYRAAFRELAAELLSDEPGREADPPSAPPTPDALAAVAVSLINGCAVQMMIDPEGFDTDAYLAAVVSLVERVAPAPRAASRARSRASSSARAR
jgi:AcrR family transcriptional regulator